MNFASARNLYLPQASADGTKPPALPAAYFKCPELSLEEQQLIIGKAKHSAKSLVDNTRTNEGPVRWEEAGSQRGVQLYKGVPRYPESGVVETITYGCSAITIQATMDEVAEFYDLSTDDKMAEFVQFNDDILEGQLLYAFQDPTLLNDPKYNTPHREGCSKMLNANQITVKWFVLDTPKLATNRDFLTIECQSTFRDVSGRRGWVRAYHSVKMPCCPELQSEYGLIRGSFYNTGYVFVESERPGFLDVIFSSQVDFKDGVTSGPLYSSIQKKRLSSIADLHKLITRRQISAQRFLSDLEVVPKAKRSHCSLCSSKFGLLTRKARCRKCGEVVCTSSCTTEWEIVVAGEGLKKVRVCNKCVQETRPESLEEMPLSAQYSDSVPSAEEEQEQQLMSVRPPGYQYNRRETVTSVDVPDPRSRAPRSVGQPSVGSDHGSNGHRRQLSLDGRKSNLSYEDGQNTNDPRCGMPANPTNPPQRFGGEPLANYAQPVNGDLRYDPRYQEPYDGEPCREAPPPYMDQRALQHQQQVLLQQQQQQQRVLQQQQVRQKFLMQQQQQQQALLRRRQQQKSGQVQFQPRLTRQTSLGCSSFGGSDDDYDDEGPQVPLTSSVLKQHTKQMGRPGPVDKMVRNRRGSLDHRQPSRRMQQRQWEMQEAAFQQRNAKQAPPALADDIESLDASGARLPSFFRQNSAGVAPPPQLKRFPSGTTQRTVSMTRDEDSLAGKQSSLASGLSSNFDTLLRPEDLRPSEDNMSLDSSINSMGVSGHPGLTNAKSRAQAFKTTVMTLNQQILYLTKKRHALENQPEADPKEKKIVDKELAALYQKLEQVEI